MNLREQSRSTGLLVADGCNGRLEAENTPVANAPAAMELAIQSKKKTGAELQALIANAHSEPAETGTEIPLDLQGSWCPPDQLDPGATDCLNLSDFVVRHGGKLSGTGTLKPADPIGRKSLISTFSLCTEGNCTGGEGLIDFAYYPPGAEWECIEGPESFGCSPEDIREYTTKNEQGVYGHDAGWPRLVQRYYDDGERKQGAPLLLNLQTESSYPNMPDSLVSPAVSWPDPYHLTRVNIDGQRSEGYLFASDAEEGAQLFRSEGESAVRVLEDVERIEWLGASAAVNGDGQAYTWRPNMFGLETEGSLESPVYLNELLDLKGPVAQIEWLLCPSCTSDPVDPWPSAIAVLYQDGTASLIHEGEPKSLREGSTFVSMDTNGYDTFTLVTTDGQVLNSDFHGDVSEYDFGDAFVTQACKSSELTFAVSADGDLLESDGTSHQTLTVPNTQSATAEIDCSPYALYADGEFGYSAARVFVLLKDGGATQYFRPYESASFVPMEWAHLLRSDTVKIQDSLVLTRDVQDPADQLSVTTGSASLEPLGIYVLKTVPAADGAAVVGWDYD